MGFQFSHRHSRASEVFLLTALGLLGNGHHCGGPLDPGGFSLESRDEHRLAKGRAPEGVSPGQEWSEKFVWLWSASPHPKPRYFLL